MDGRARRRRVGGVLCTVAAIIVALGAASQLSTGSRTPYEGEDEVTATQSDEAPDSLHTTTPQPTAPAREDPDSVAPVTTG